MLIGLILAAILDLALAVLLVGLSGFIFGGQEGAGGEVIAVMVWLLGLTLCIAAPVAGFVLRAQGQAGWVCWRRLSRRRWGRTSQ